MSSAAQKKNKKQDAGDQIDSNAVVDESGDMHPVEKELQKKIRNAKKKLGQITDLLQKSKDKEIVLNDEQKEKVGGKKAIEAQIKDFED